MCYSAMVWADYRRYVKEFGAEISVKDFVKLAERRIRDRSTWPKAMVDAFTQASTPAGLEVKALLGQYATQEAVKLQEGLFAQRKRLSDAERVLAGPKPTKKASEDQRIATNKIEQALGRLADLQRVEPKERVIFKGICACATRPWSGRTTAATSKSSVPTSTFASSRAWPNAASATATPGPRPWSTPSPRIDAGRDGGEGPAEPVRSPGGYQAAGRSLRAEEAPGRCRARAGRLQADEEGQRRPADRHQQDRAGPGQAGGPAAQRAQGKGTRKQPAAWAMDSEGQFLPEVIAKRARAAVRHHR